MHVCGAIDHRHIRQALRLDRHLVAHGQLPQQAEVAAQGLQNHLAFRGGRRCRFRSDGGMAVSLVCFFLGIVDSLAFGLETEAGPPPMKGSGPVFAFGKALMDD